MECTCRQISNHSYLLHLDRADPASHTNAAVVDEEKEVEAWRQGQKNFLMIDHSLYV